MNNTVYMWRWRKRLGERHGQRCRILARGSKNSVLIEFEDGYCVVTSRWAVRRVTELQIVPGMPRDNNCSTKKEQKDATQADQ